ncbi:cell division protein ZapD [Alteromonadaceae bacterium M269]|nr:cell division protein ZapD [Alteromonadaceae bacterium M269]
MSHTLYEFPLNEKVRSYLRLEQLFQQLEHTKDFGPTWSFMTFFESLFTLLDLLDRLDVRNDMLKDIEIHEKNLQHWSKHPKIDLVALQKALDKVTRLKEQLRNARKIGNTLKEDKFLNSIKQRFAIPGGTCSFDLPNLHYWLKQPQDEVQQDINQWLSEFTLVQDSLDIALSFLRERGKFTDATAAKGFYQGIADDKIELIRIHCSIEDNYYPTLSGNKYRYAIRFMNFESNQEGSTSVTDTIDFKLAAC